MPADTREALKAIVGQHVWCTVQHVPLIVCAKCGAPGRLCNHTSMWMPHDVLAIVDGTLVDFRVDNERVVLSACLDGAWWENATGIYTTEAAARLVRSKEYVALNKIAAWASPVPPIVSAP